MQFNERETATILAGLRVMQQAMSDGPGIPTIARGHFAECNPLGFDEIDALCEDLGLMGIDVEHVYSLGPVRHVFQQETTPILDQRYQIKGFSSDQEHAHSIEEAAVRMVKPPFCSACSQVTAYVRPGVYQCLTGEHSRNSCKLFGRAVGFLGDLIPFGRMA